MLNYSLIFFLHFSNTWFSSLSKYLGTSNSLWSIFHWPNDVVFIRWLALESLLLVWFENHLFSVMYLVISLKLNFRYCNSFVSTFSHAFWIIQRQAENITSQWMLAVPSPFRCRRSVFLCLLYFCITVCGCLVCLKMIYKHFESF